jgi:HEAT repeat protein
MKEKENVSNVLGELKDPRAVDNLINLLIDNDRLKKNIHWSSEDFRDPDNLRSSITWALGKIGDKAVDPLINLLEKTTNNDLRRSISRTLGYMGNPKAIDPLIVHLEKTTNNDLRKKISEALGDIGEKAVDPIINLLQRTDKNILKKYISEVLGNMKDPRAIDPLMDLLQETKDNSLRKSISEALGKIGEEAIDPLWTFYKKQKTTA